MTISISWGLVSPPKGDHNHHEKKAKTPSEGEGNDVLWPENNNKKNYKIKGYTCKIRQHSTSNTEGKRIKSKH